MTAGTKRDQLVETAARLFYEEGFHATGIDRVLAEAGVAKMTLYNNFPSKDDLMVAAIDRAAERLQDEMRTTLKTAADNPRDRVLVLFDFYDGFFHNKRFHGCLFVNAAAEFGEEGHPVHDAAARYKRALRDLCVRLVEETGAPDSVALGRQIALLIEGAITAAHVLGDRDAARVGKAAAACLLDAALGPVAE